MGIPRKRAFEATTFGTSNGFKALSMPCNIETLNIEKITNQSQQMSEAAKARVAALNVNQAETVFSDAPAGSRLPKPCKKT